jgi:hypothetical protein
MLKILLDHEIHKHSTAIPYKKFCTIQNSRHGREVTYNSVSMVGRFVVPAIFGKGSDLHAVRDLHPIHIQDIMVMAIYDQKSAIRRRSNFAQPHYNVGYLLEGSFAERLM